MAESSSQERTEKPTPRRKQKAREKGEMAQSREWQASLVLFGGFFMLLFFREPILLGFQDIFQSLSASMPQLIWNEGQIPTMLHLLTRKALFMLLPLFGVVVLAAFVGSWSQVGFHVSSESIKIQFSRLNPISGLKKIFSERLLTESFKTTLKLTGLGLISFFNIRNVLSDGVFLMGLEPGPFVEEVTSRLLVLGLHVGLFMLVLTVMDYAVQRKQFMKRIMMTRKEVKDELKDVEGNPHVKSKIKGLMKKLSGKRMLEKVDDAQVVVTNPTHFAVAIQYTPTMTAPLVLAKGADLIAKKIIQRAREKGIPVVENKPLARLLYRWVEIEEPVPMNMYQAVAEVLAYVYQLSQKSARRQGAY